MKLMPSRTQIVALFALAAVALVLALMPHWRAPHFRYTGSNPEHHVWNLGWPLATCIYDSSHAPHFFVGPFAYAYAFVAILGFVLLYSVFVAWNNRRGMLLETSEVEAAH